MKQLLSVLFGGLVDWFKGKQEMKKAAMENKARLLRDKNSNNHEWEMANLLDKDKTLRLMSFLMFAFPFIAAIFNAQAVNEYFTVAVASVPLWWQQMFVAIVGSVWGIASLKNVLPAAVDGIKKALKK